MTWNSRLSLSDVADAVAAGVLWLPRPHVVPSNCALVLNNILKFGILGANKYTEEEEEVQPMK